MIAENLKDIGQRIEAAALKSGRRPEDITLIGVTKTIGIEQIKELLALGITDLGENRVQEIMEKYPALGTEPNWHLIGHLQTNKVKYIIDKVKMIHSVDSIRLAEEIDKRAAAISKVMDVLIEVNVADEQSKFGVKLSETFAFAERLCQFKHIRIKGLMTVAPYVEEPSENREIFRMLRNLSVDIKGNFVNNIDMDFLSMGMTNDYEVAIEEGANMVRIGTGIFGERNYNA